MNKLGEISLMDVTDQELKSINKRLKSIHSTLIWLKSQDYDDGRTAENIQTDKVGLRLRKQEIIEEIKKQSKNIFPNGKKIVVTKDRKEVEIYG